MLVVLQEIPRTLEQWERWSYHHRTSHEAILQALHARGVALTEYLLDPINWNQPDIFLQNNSQAHIDMTAAVGQQSVDLQDVNLRDEKQHEAWTNLHFLEHQSVELALGL